ncbi:MAG: FHA domain-containing protein [Myxococcota bacterium]
MLEHLQSRTRYVLGSPTLVGRAALCQIQITAPVVSSTHAMLRWTGRSWEVQDLGSRNGVYINSTRMAPGPRVLLRDGDEICFGDLRDPWRVHLHGPPLARASSGGTILTEQDGLLMVPSNPPEAFIYRADGQWWMDRSDDIVRVDDGDEVEIVGKRWRLLLPTDLRATQELTGSEQPVRLHFVVSADEEHVTLQIQHGSHQHRVDHRIWSYLLLTLARERMATRDQPKAEQGWVYHDKLARRLSMSRTQFNMAIFRARQQLSQLGVPNAYALIERRRGSGQIRIGDVLLAID